MQNQWICIFHCEAAAPRADENLSSDKAEMFLDEKMCKKFYSSYFFFKLASFFPHSLIGVTPEVSDRQWNEMHPDLFIIIVFLFFFKSQNSLILNIVKNIWHNLVTQLMLFRNFYHFTSPSAFSTENEAVISIFPQLPDSFDI